MKKKIVLISTVISVILMIIILVIFFYTQTEREKKAREELENSIKQEVAIQKIDYFTNNYFTFLEKVMVEYDKDDISVSVSFVPEVGSIPIKEEIYQSIAYYSLQILNFYPEVNHFEYNVLWDNDSKQKVLTLSIDEDAIKQLSDLYYGECMNQDSGFETSFKSVFSSIVETEESKLWRDTVDINSDLP